jgi:hypothetical protein
MDGATTDSGKDGAGGANSDATNDHNADAALDVGSDTVDDRRVDGGSADGSVDATDATVGTDATDVADATDARPVDASADAPNDGAGTCKNHSDCATGICKSGGACASPSEVAYVNNTNGPTVTCSDVMHASTQTAPYCQVSAASSLSGKSFIVVAGSATAYNALSFMATGSNIGPITIVGPGRKAVLSATIAAPSAPAMIVNGSGATATITLDGFELASGASSSVVSCTGTASLTLLNSTIRGNLGTAVVSTSATIVLDGNIIGPMNAGGVKLLSSSYVITNNIIQGNGPGLTPGVLINSSTGTFAFNTVAGNHVTGGVGGVQCSGQSNLIANSIVWGNDQVGGTQLDAACQLSTVVTGTDNHVGATQLNPAFFSASDFHLDVSTAPARTTNAACCVDKLAAPGTPNADHDVDRTSRPKGSSLTPYDVGAHEAQ